MTIVAAVLLTALVMGYPLHRVTVERDQARAQLRHPSTRPARHLRVIQGGRS